MNDISLVLTEKCNWTCGYCHFTNLKQQKEPSLEVYQTHLPYIRKVLDTLECHGVCLSIDVQGGEVGTIPIEMLQVVFQTLGRKISVSTNGEFIRKRYHRDARIRPFIERILWHITDDFDSVVDDYTDEELFISKGIVHDNEDEIVKFIKANSHITFDYVEFEFDINEKNEMQPSMYKSLLGKLRHLDNVTPQAIKILEGRLSEKKEHRQNCRRMNGSILIDLVNENICLCQRQLDDCIPLNKYNLIDRLRGFPKDFFEGKHCDTCTRLYYGKMQGNVIETSMKIRSVL